MKKLKFYDLKKRKSFFSSNYKITTRLVRGKKRKFAVAKSPSGIDSWRIM